MTNGNHHEEYLGVHFTLEEQYSQFFNQCNWYTFNFFKLEIDHDKSIGSLDVTVLILGLGFRVTYNYELNDDMKGILNEVEKIKRNRP